MVNLNRTPYEEKNGKYYYYERPGKYDTIYCRKLGLHGREEIILDGDLELERHKGKVMIHEVKISRDHQYLAVAKDAKSDGTFILEIRDLNSGLIVDSIELITSFEWGLGNEIYYVMADKTLRPNRLVRRVIGSGNDQILYKDDDSSSFLDLSRSKDFKYQFLFNRKEEHVSVSLLTLDGALKKVGLFRSNVPFFIGSKGDKIVICHKDNLNEGNKLDQVSLEDIEDRSKWETLEQFPSDTTIDNIDFFEVTIA